MIHAIFISYRRKDALTEARAIYERLRAEFGAGRVFIDLEGLDFGVDFAEVLEQQLKNCKIMLVLMGSNWIGMDPVDGARRIDDEYDFVRTEVRAALSRNIRVIPVLLDGISMPRSQDLPEDIRGLLRRHYFELDFHRFDSDVGRLVVTLGKIVNESSDVALKSRERESESLPANTTPEPQPLVSDIKSINLAHFDSTGPTSLALEKFDIHPTPITNPSQQDKSNADLGRTTSLDYTNQASLRNSSIRPPQGTVFNLMIAIIAVAGIALAFYKPPSPGSPSSGPLIEAPKVTSVPTPTSRFGGVIKIGHVGPTSGAIAHLGKDNEYGARMAIDELNAANITIGGQPAKFELLAEDDAADPRQGVAAAQKLVDAKVNGVIGHLNSGTTIPASQIYNDAGIPQISPSATNPRYTRQGYAGVFRVVADDVQLGRTLARYAVETLEGQNIAIIDDRTAYGQGVADEFEKGVTAAGGKIVGREFTNDKATDFNVILTTLKAKKPDIVFFGGMDAVAGPMLKQMKQLGIKAKFMGGDGICSSGLVDLASNSMSDEQVYCAEAGGAPAGFEAGMQKFTAEFKAKFNADVQVYAPYVYDSVMVMVKAMRAADSSEPAKYLPKLKEINYRGITGQISFDEKGDIKNGAFTLYTYKHGRRAEIAVIN